MTNPLTARWAAGETTFGVWGTLDSAFAAELIAAEGPDYLCLDQQHGILGLDTTVACLQAVRGSAIAPVVRVLAPGGRCAVLTYHSGEDRIIASRFRHHATGGIDVPPGLTRPTGAPEPAVRILRAVPKRPTPEEAEANPRSRSARLRVVEKVGARLMPAAAPAVRSPARPAPSPKPVARPNLTVVEPRRRLRAGPTIVLGVLLFFGIALGLVVAHALLVQGQQDLDGLDGRVAEARRTEQELRLRVAELEAPDRIIAAATDLGMVPPEGVTYLTPAGAVTAGAPPVTVQAATPATAPVATDTEAEADADDAVADDADDADDTATTTVTDEVDADQ